MTDLTKQDGSPGDRSDGEDEEELIPLLSHIVTRESEAEMIRQHFDYPDANSLFFMQIGLGAGYCAYMLTAWLYVVMQHEEIFPDCSDVWPWSPHMKNACEASIIFFWTFPLFCCIFLLVFFYRDLLQTRLYYEMLSHRVMLDFENVPFLQSRVVQFMLSWMLLGIMMYPLANNITLRAAKATMPYWIPVLSFGGMVIGYWDLETRLLSIAKFVEGDIDWAKEHFEESFFVRDFVAKQAFLNVREEVARVQHIHTTGTFILAISAEASNMADRGDLDMDLEPEGMFEAWSNKYWVTDFLYSKHLDDKRATRFRHWFMGYMIYTVIMLVLLFYLAVSTTITHLHQQHVIEESWATRLFTVDHFKVMPKPVKLLLLPEQLQNWGL